VPSTRVQEPPAPADGLVHACLFDGRGGAVEIGWAEIERWRPGAGFLWVHLDYAGVRAREWLADGSGLDPVIVETLTQLETRPRTFASGKALVVLLRGVNANPNSDPEDMVSIRMWIEEGRAITLRHRRVLAAQDLRTCLADERGPRDAGSFLVGICDRLLDRILPVVAELDDATDALEGEVLTAESYELRTRIASLRRDAVGLRRYLAPQREAMTRLVAESVAWISETDRMRLRELSDRVTRCVEDIDAARERAAVTREELDTRLAERMNRTMYVISIVTAIFLPLSLVTGMWGLNVGGIPFTGDPSGFVIMCSVIAAIATTLALFFRRLKWI
jgi:zinc transporter